MGQSFAAGPDLPSGVDSTYPRNHLDPYDRVAARRARAAARLPLARRPLGATPVPLLARSDRRHREHGPRAEHERDGAAARRSPDLPRRPRVPGRRRLPRPARAGDPRRAPREGQRGVHDRDADRALERGCARGRVVARPEWKLRAGRDPREEHPARCARCAPGRVGLRLARLASPARQPADPGGGGRAASRRRARRRGALRGRGDPLPAALPDDARAAPARGPHLVDPARRGDGGRRLRPQLAALVVGVARADGDRVRARRLRRPVAATAAARRRPLRVALSRPDGCACKRGVRERARATRRPARERRRRRAAASG